MKKSILTLVMCALCAPAFASDDEPAATPSRPTVASGASISAPGWIEAEFGLQRIRPEPGARRDSLPYLLKYSVNENWALWLGGEAHIRDRVAGMMEHGFGDTAVTLKHKFALNEGPHSAGLEATVKIPTASEHRGLGSGERDYTLKGIYGIDLPGGFHYDTNLAVTRLGSHDLGTGRNSYLFANAVSRPVSDNLTLAADLSTTMQHGTKPSAQFMMAGSYAYSKRVVIDAGAQFGVSKLAPDWTLFTGVTVLIGKPGN